MRFRVDRPVVRVEVGSDLGAVEGGQVEVREYGTVLGTATVHDGVATITLPAYTKKGAHRLTVTYLGTPDAAPSATTVDFEVVK